MTLVLDQETIEAITGYKRYSSQYKALSLMGLEYTPRPKDGFPLVLERHFNEVMGYTDKTVKQELEFKPNFDALR
jgi:hypothetical protein